MKKYSFFGIIGGILIFLTIIAFVWSVGQVSQSNPTSDTPLTPATTPSEVSNPQSAPIVPQQPTSVTPKSWHTITTFSGSGQENTAPFTIKGSQWRVNWTETLSQNPLSFCEQSACSMYVYVYPVGKTNGDWSDQFSTASLQDIGTATGTAYEYMGAGNFYIATNPAFINKWTLTIEDYY